MEGYQESLERTPPRIEQLLRCIVCERVLGQYVVSEPRQLIVKCRHCGVLQARHLQ